MNKETWNAFRKTVNRYRLEVEKITAAVPNLAAIIQKLIDSREGPSYQAETPAVFNQALDDFTEQSSIKLILVGDNPGRREQENRRYLVGPSGKIAEKFFLKNFAPEIDWRKNVLILNKTPIHTPRTAELKTLYTLGGIKTEEIILSSQKTMAELLHDFWLVLSGESGRTVPVWIIGYSEMKKGGIFEIYTETLKTICSKNTAFGESIYFFRHFSMNQFTIDLKKRAINGESTQKSLERIGKAYRRQILGF